MAEGGATAVRARHSQCPYRRAPRRRAGHRGRNRQATARRATGGSLQDRSSRQPRIPQGAGLIVESTPAPDLVIAEMQRRASTPQQAAKTFFPLRNRHRGDRFTIEVEEIEQEKDGSAAVARVRSVLDQG